MNTEDLIKAIKATDLRATLPTNENGTKYRKRGTEGIQGICFHQALGTGSLEAVHKYHTGPNHMAANGLERISYTIGVRTDGEICVMNDLETKTWSQGDRNRQGDENAQFLSVMFQGAFKWGNETEYLGMDLTDPTDAQMGASHVLWRDLATLFNFGTDDLKGHFDFGKPACPGNLLETFIRSVRAKGDFSDLFLINKFITDNGFEGNADFQERMGLTADGIWGPNTAAAAKRYLAQNT